MATLTTTSTHADVVPTTAAQDAMALVGRILIALLFVPSGWGKIVGFSGTVGYIASKGVPLPEVCAAIAIAAELGLGLLLLVGYQPRWAALGLDLPQLLGPAGSAADDAEAELQQEPRHHRRPAGLCRLGRRPAERRRQAQRLSAP